jgi:peptide methionine sulfoxide reductase MsrB
MDQIQKRRSGSHWQEVILIVLLMALGATAFIITQSVGTNEQPLAFNHQVMVQLGIGCLFCHSDALRTPVAGMPSVERCMGCHTVIATQADTIQSLAGYWKRQEPIQWVRVNSLPRFVYFSHRAHVLAGALNCEQCHGDVGHMTVAEPTVKMNMGWCLNCHRDQENKSQLMDCFVCHQ